MSTQKNRGKTPMSSILQASQNSNASNTNILKLTQENIRSTIPNESDYRRNPNSTKNSEYSIPMYDTMSVTSTRSRNRTTPKTHEKIGTDKNVHNNNDDNDDDNISVLSFNSTYSAKTTNSERYNDNDDDDNASVISFQSTFSEYTNNDNKTITNDILEKSKKTISNLPSDIYKILKTFHNTKDDVKYRSKFQIPSEFNVYYYLLRYPRFGNIYDYNYKKVVGLYKHYYEAAKRTHPMDDKYYRIRYSIPDIFSYETYYERYQPQLKNMRLKSDNISVYRYYYRQGFKTFPLDTLYLRLYMKIHKYFDIQMLFQRYDELKDYEETFNTTNEIEVYNFYNSINKDKFSIDDKYFRLFFHIPNEFESNSYRKRYNHVSEINALQNQEDCETYAYFEKSGKMHHTLDEKYYFILHSLPDDFDCSVYKERYSEKFEENDGYAKITTFYAKNKESYSLDEQYYFILHSLPEDFDCYAYKKRYSKKFEENDGYAKITTFYAKNKESCSLDEKYYFILHSLPEDFDCSVYKKRYPEKFEESVSYHQITTFYAKNKESYSLDEQYFEMKYNIQNDFNWKKYGEAFFNFLDNMEDSRNIGKMYRLYNEKFHEKYEKKIYDHYLILKNDLSSVNKELYNKLYLFMIDDVDDETFTQFSDWKLTYNNIYSAMLNGKMRDEFNFRTSMSLLLRKCDFSNERDYRVFIKMNSFFELEKYYQTPAKTTKYITEHYTEKEFVEKKPIYRRRMVEKKIEELTEEQKEVKMDPNEDKNKLDELLKKINKDEPIVNNSANNTPNFSSLGALNLGKVISTMRDKRNNKNNVLKKEEQTQDTNTNSKSKVNDLINKITSNMNQGVDLQEIANEMKQNHST